MENSSKKHRTTAVFAISAAFAAGAVAYFAGYKIAMNKFNNIISYNREKEQMYYKLSEVDRAIRQEYIRDIDESELMRGLSMGYISGLNDDLCMYLEPAEYKKYISREEHDESAVTCKKLEDNIGYIRIKYLTSEAGNMFCNCVRELVENGAQDIVLDIRDLSGTNIDAASKCLDSIVEEGDTILSINKKGETKVVHKAVSDGLDTKFCVVVNGDTSGTSELIASALRDSQRGLIVGTRTAGNALQLKAVPLPDGSGVVFPVAHYVTKSEQIFADTGICPDIEVNLPDRATSFLDNDTSNYHSDPQISEAVQCLQN